MPPTRLPAPARTFFKRSGWWAAVIIAVVGSLAYSNSFQVPFVFDDEVVMFQNPSIRTLRSALFPPQDDLMGGTPISGRPLVNLSIALNYAIGGTEVRSYHFFNLLVHLTCGILVFAIVRRTLELPRLAESFGSAAFELALVIAVLWTVHPLQTESVTYISQRAESLVGLMYLLTVWCYLRAAQPSGSAGWSICATAACLGGMLTKEVMVSAPLFLALYDRTFLADSWAEVWARRKKLLLALASTWVVLAWIVMQGGGKRGLSAGFGLGVSPWHYLLQQCEALVLYLKLCFWPHPLVLDYGTRIATQLQAVAWQGGLVVALLGGTAWALRYRPALGCIGAWFFLILAPTSSIVPLVGQTMAEHRMYLPLAAVVVAAVTLAYRWLGRRALLIASILAVPLMAATFVRNQDYATTIGLYEDTVARVPDNARAMALLADYYHRAGNLPKAREWLERSLKIQPDIVPVLNNLGNVWQELGEVSRAVPFYRRALALAPEDLNTTNNLAAALIANGQESDGVSLLDAAVRRTPESIPLRLNLARALVRSHRMTEAADQFRKVLETTPDDAQVREQYSDVLMALGQKDEAIQELERAVRASSHDADLHNRLGTALGRAGRVREALEQFHEALRLDPAHASARINAERAERYLRGR